MTNRQICAINFIVGIIFNIFLLIILQKSSWFILASVIPSFLSIYLINRGEKETSESPSELISIASTTFFIPLILVAISIEILNSYQIMTLLILMILILLIEVQKMSE